MSTYGLTELMEMRRAKYEPRWCVYRWCDRWKVRRISPANLSFHVKGEQWFDTFAEAMACATFLSRCVDPLIRYSSASAIGVQR